MSKVRDLRKIFSCMKPYRGAFVLAALFVIVESAFEMVIPMIMADVIDVGVAAHDVNYILVQGVKMCGCALLSLITGLLYARYAAIAANGFAAELREREFAAIQTYSFSNLDHFENASLITRMTSDVNVMQNIVSTGLRPMVRGPIMLVLGIAMAFMINGELAFVFIVLRAAAGDHPVSDRAQDRADVCAAAEGDRPGECHRAGKPDGHPRRQGLRARRI